MGGNWGVEAELAMLSEEMHREGDEGFFIAGIGDDPLGKKPSDELGKSEMDALLYEGDPESAAVIHGAIEDFANKTHPTGGQAHFFSDDQHLSDASQHI
jgi:hypothetical protein